MNHIASTKAKAALTLLCMAQMMILTDTSIVHVALPSIGSAMGASTAELQWVVTAYTLLFGGCMLVGGRAGDLLGMRRMLMIGMAVFTLASMLGGWAASGTALIAARALQGLGAALLAPSVVSLASRMFPEGPARHRALGAIGAVNAVGFSLGLLLGGVLTEAFGWPSVFFVNVPFGIAFLALAPKFLPDNAALRQPLDVPGAAAATAGLTLFVLAFSLADAHGLMSAPVGLLLAGAAALLASFVLLERRTIHPLVPLRLFGNRGLIGANLATAVFGAVIAPMFFFLTFYMQNVLGLNSLWTGLAFLPHSVLVWIATGVAAKAVARHGARRVLLCGMAAFGAGFAWLTFITPEGGYWTAVLPGTLLVGLGVATIVVAGVIAATSDVGPQEQGLASGLWNTAIPVGSSIGMAVSSLAVELRAERLAAQLGPVLAYVEGIRASFFLALALVAVGFVGVYTLMDRTKRETAKAVKRGASAVP